MIVLIFAGLKLVAALALLAWLKWPKLSGTADSSTSPAARADAPGCNSKGTSEHDN